MKVAALLAAGVFAHVPGDLTVIASKTSHPVGPQRPSVVSLTAAVENVHQLFVRGVGRALRGEAFLSCSARHLTQFKRRWLSRLVPWKLYPLLAAARGDCVVTAALTGRGRLRLEVLAR